ncbi:HmuY family protein [Prevotella aurantiaca]|jgi:putative lipoprotein|uniref:HmuY family protein n=1 Tax=Prevotella aurantiaca TaxID=596085 RepID=UPI0023F4DFE6
MNLKSILALSCLSVLLLASCGSEDAPTPKPDQPEDVPTKTLSFVTQRKTMEDYDKWVYVNLETGETVMKDDVSAQEWRTYSADGKKKDRFGTFDVTKMVDERPSNAPEKWHLAFHVYDVMTNGGEAHMSDTTDINTIKTLPTNVKWVSDVKAYLIYDMRGMMQKPAVLGYMKSYVNMGLYYWMHKVSGTMGEYALTMAKSDPEKTPVFLVKFKDGSYAVIQFTGLKDATGKQKEVSFRYKYVKNN